jgi:hypothetical protein
MATYYANLIEYYAVSVKYRDYVYIFPLNIRHLKWNITSKFPPAESNKH